MGAKEQTYTFAHPAAVAKIEREKFVPDFDEDDVPPLE